MSTKSTNDYFLELKREGSASYPEYMIKCYGTEDAFQKRCIDNKIFNFSAISIATSIMY